MASLNESVLSNVLARTVFYEYDRTGFISMCTPVYCPDMNGIKADKVYIIKPGQPAPATINGGKMTIDSNMFICNLNQKCELSIGIPNDVDLKSNFELLEICRAYFAGQFASVVNKSIEKYIMSNVGTLFAKDSTETTINGAIAKAKYKIDRLSTGIQGRVYKYSNGAPVVYTQTLEQFNVEMVSRLSGALKEADDFMSYLDGVYGNLQSNTPALYYTSRPTLILKKENYLQLQKDLIDKISDSRYINQFQMDMQATDFAISGYTYDMIMGTNNCFALCYTEPRIQIVKDNSNFQDIVKCQIFYGIVDVDNTGLSIMEFPTTG